jgi:hypothetical protein
MKKKEKSENKSSKKSKSSENTQKTKNLFDHLSQIRTTKDPNYWNTLSDKEKKDFNHWMILTGLSQDESLIPMCSKLWKGGYYDKIPSPQFYTLLCQLVPYSDRKIFWNKGKKKNLILLKYISQWFCISTREADEYLSIFMTNDSGMTELAKILEGCGLNDLEAEKILLGKETE